MRPASEHLPLGLNHPREKKRLKIIELEHVLSEKSVNFSGTCSKSKSKSMFLSEKSVNFSGTCSRAGYEKCARFLASILLLLFGIDCPTCFGIDCPTCVKMDSASTHRDPNCRPVSRLCRPAPGDARRFGRNSRAL